MATRTIKVTMPGKGTVTLAPSDHIATGGEGAVYLKNNLVFKLFLDPARAQANGMADKVKLLSQIKHPFIVAPIDVLYDSQHQVVGYYMAQAAGVSLMKTFTNSWRDLNAFTNTHAVSLVSNMREAVTAAHALNAVIVDGNETNYLVDGVTPYLIDVDSWQIGKHPATAIMPSIRDYHAKAHNTNSDWFSWGIVTFQVFTGIHPFKGTHPSFKKGDMEARMRANASVFDTSVRLNAAVRDFSCVPKPLLGWYEGVFSHGDRSVPPSPLLSQVSPSLTKKLRVLQTGSGTIRHDRIRGLGENIRHVSANGVAFYSEGGALKAFDLYRQQNLPALTSLQIDALFANQAGLVRHADSFVLVSCNAQGCHGLVVPGERDPRPSNPSTNQLPLSAEKIVVMGNRIFAVNKADDTTLVELEVSAMGSKTALTIKHAWPVSVRSTRFFDGVSAMDCLGATFLVVPEKDTLVIQKAPVLNGYKLINGFARSGAYVWLHGVDRLDGQIYRLELVLKGTEFELVHREVVDEPELDIAVTAKGIAVGIYEDGAVTVLNTSGHSAKQVPDSSVTKEMRLFALPDGIYYSLNQDIFKLSMT